MQAEQSHSSLSLPFLLLISPTSCLGFSALQAEQSQGTQRGDVCQVPELAPASCRELKGSSATPKGDGIAKNTAGPAGIWPEVQHLFQPGRTVLER